MSIIVKPIEGMLTRDTDTFTKMDPFCVVMYGNDQRKTMAQQGAGKKPRWSETFVFQRNNDQLLRVQVWDEDVVSNDLVGEGTVNLMRTFNTPNTIQNEYVDLLYNGRSAGRVLLSIEYQGGMMVGQMGMGAHMGWQQQQMMNPMLGQQAMMGGWGQPMMQTPLYNPQPMMGAPVPPPGFNPGMMNQMQYNNGWNPNQGGYNNNGWNPNQGAFGNNNGW